MRRIFWLIPLLILVGCRPAPTATPLPTWTPTRTPNAVRPTSTPPPNILVVSPATRVLPATWTPIPDYTETPIVFEDAILTATLRISPTPSPSPTFDYQVPPPPLRGTVTASAECATFQIDRTKSSTFFIRTKEEFHINWNPLTNPVTYWVWVRHPDGRFVVRQPVDTPYITISNPNGGVPIFNAEGVYPVAVVAFRNGVQICQQLTEVIIVRG